jgi:hypothetical protein
MADRHITQAKRHRDEWDHAGFDSRDGRGGKVRGQDAESSCSS